MEQVVKKQKQGYIFIILSAVFFSIGGLLIKMNTWHSVSISGVRGIFAFLVVAFYMRMKKHRFVLNWPVVGGALANFGMGITFVMANKLTTAANAIVLQFTLPIYLILFLWIFWKKKPDRNSCITVLVAMVGICFFFSEKLSISGMWGNVLALCSGMLYAVVFLIKRIPKADFESSALISFGLSIVVAIPFLVKETNYGVMNWVTIILLGVVQFGMAYVCLSEGLDVVPPVAASLISMVEPILNPILVAFFYGEYIGTSEMIGAVIVLGAATFYNVIEAKKVSGNVE